MRAAHVRTICIVALGCAFAVDLATPQLFVAAILLDAPIVLSSLTRSGGFTARLVVAALCANVVAGYVNGVQDHHHWDALGIGDRILCGLSIVFTGYLSTAVGATAERAGRLTAINARVQREARVSAAVDRLRASLSPELVATAIVREAIALFDARRAMLWPASSAAGPPGTGALVAEVGGDVRDAPLERSPELASLVQRLLDDREPSVMRPTDAFARLVLDNLQCGSLLAFALADRDRRFGVVLLSAEAPTHFDEALPAARLFAGRAAEALAQASLFAQLDERNTALAERGAVIADLVYAISHDLRTPLAALGMTLRQAHAGAFGPLPAAYEPIVERSIVAVDDTTRLAQTLLLVARFESGDRRPQRERIDLAALAQQIAGEFAATAAAKAIRLELVADDAVDALADRDDVRRAVTNLIANAIEHGRDGGYAVVTVGADGASAVVRVDDDGFGVPDAERERLFTRFARGRGRAGGGSGLGLYIVRRVAEESGGCVAYAPRPGGGSRFELRLPAAPA